MANVRRSHHQVILDVLKSMNAGKLREMQCYFGGGTAISLLADEYRESVDIDFLCSSKEGYANLRESVFDYGINELFLDGAPALARPIVADRDGVRAMIIFNDTIIKFEMVMESRIALMEEPSWLPVATLSRTCLFAEKLLANTDRGLDKSAMSKDILDLIVMEKLWGFDNEALKMAHEAYRSSVDKAYNASIDLLKSNPDYLKKCLEQTKVSDDYKQVIEEFLSPSKHPSCK